MYASMIYICIYIYIFTDGKVYIVFMCIHIHIYVNDMYAFMHGQVHIL